MAGESLLQKPITVTPSHQDAELLGKLNTIRQVRSSKMGSMPGGVTPLYKLYRYVPPQRVWFLSRLIWSENGYRF